MRRSHIPSLTEPVLPDMCGWLYVILLWVEISIYLSEFYHGNIYYHKIIFGTTPDIIQFTKYKLWDPI